jgi:copper homeostasis protein
MNNDVALEVCVDSVESAVEAEQGGAQRVELCSGLPEGGITPSVGLLASVRKVVSIDVNVMIRPRGGDFCYSHGEIAAMERDISVAKQEGADGVVFGILNLDGNVDVELVQRLVQWASPMRVTFHRAFDMSSDLFQALRDLASTGVCCVLTSGGRQSVMEGAETIRRLVTTANSGIRIMAGGGVEAGNVAAVMEQTGVREIHASLRVAAPSPMRYRNKDVSMGTLHGVEYQRFVVDRAMVKKMVQTMRG